MSFKSSRTFVIVALALVLAVASYAFAAANTVDASGAGDGQAAISGYDITNIHYVLAADPSTIDAVEMDIASITAGVGAPNVVKIQLVASGDWYNCSVKAANTYTCSVGGAVTVENATILRVVAAE